MRKLKEKLFLKEYDEEKIKIANKTARASGASALNKDGSIRSVVGRYVLDNVSKDASILDFGSGPAAVQTLALRDAGFKNVSAYDFGVNTRDGIQDPDALNKKYDVVFASNVLNVSSDEEMLRETLRDIKKAAKNEIVFNYPSSPRKSGLNAQEVRDIIIDEYGVEPELVSGTKSAPVWKVLLNSSKNISEDTVKTRDGKWTNRGDSGETHGEFRTKKQADAQRKAIYASGWKKESVEDLANRVRKNDLEWDDEIEASYAEDGDVAVQFQDRETLTHEVTPYRSRRPRVSSNTWGRIWKNGDLVYNERGPKYKVRDNVIKKLNSMNESFESDLERKLVRMWFNEDQAAWLVKHDPETAEWLAYGNIRTQDLIDVEREINQKMAVKLIESVESTEFYGVFEKGGSIGKSYANRDNLHAWSGRDAGTLVKVFSSSDEAKNYAKRMRSRLSPGERSYYGMGYFVKKLSKKDLEHPQVIDMISNMPGSSASQVDEESLNESDDVWSTPESAAKSLFDRGLVASDYVERACKRHGKDNNFAHEVEVIIDQMIEEDEHLGESKSINEDMSIDKLKFKDTKYEGSRKATFSKGDDFIVTVDESTEDDGEVYYTISIHHPRDRRNNYSVDVGDWDDLKSAVIAAKEATDLLNGESCWEDFNDYDDDELVNTWLDSQKFFVEVGKVYIWVAKRISNKKWVDSKVAFLLSKADRDRFGFNKYGSINESKSINEDKSISLSEEQLDKAMELIDEIYEACQRIYHYNEDGEFKEGLDLNEWSIYAAAADLHDIVERGSLTESTETDETPWSYKEVEDTLKSLSNNWRDKSGVCKCWHKEEKQHAVKILRKHYKTVEVSQDGDWTVIAFETPI